MIVKNILNIRNKQPTDILYQFSPSLFWNCDVSKLHYKKNKKIIIERIIENGKESDEILMWKIYSYREIKNVALNSLNLEKDKLMYMSFILQIPEEKFKSYEKRQWVDMLKESYDAI